MITMTSKELAITLATTEKEEDIVKLLTDLGYWNNYNYWHSFGDNDNNFSTIGNQQSKPDAALVEKFINSVDAILMKECLIRNIDMTSDAAPQSISKALQTFFGIREGQISYLDTKTRNNMSENIILAATGNKFHMNLTIADKGEGQTPNRMPDTILSISRNNKLRVPFVQGKFNMGGTGVLPFCGNNRLQLVISKRCPDIPNETNDESFDFWSVTIVRRETAREGRRSSMFTYLTDETGNILRFKADKLPIIPRPQDASYQDMTYGTYFKLYDYALQGYKSNVLFDFNYRMSMLMPDLAHPIRIRECRSTYTGHSFETTLSGLQTRLLDDRQKNIEDGFPCSETFSVSDQNLRCNIYLFKKGKSDNYRKKEGILYIVNGQTHATVSESFFNRVGLSYLADSLLLLIDCSDVDISHREDMFMNSRDRLRGGDFVKNIEDRIKEILRDHSLLKKIQNERRAAAIQEHLNDDKPLQDVLQHILDKSPVLSKVLLKGGKLTNPFNISNSAGNSDNFIGKKHPTLFKLIVKSKKGNLVKQVPINHDFRVQFETDVENDYFGRPTEKGALILMMDGNPHPELIKRLNLLNGTATLTISLPPGTKVGDTHTFHTEIIDECIVNKFENDFSFIATNEASTTPGGNSSGNRTPPRGQNTQGNRPETGSLAMPNIQEKHQSDWESLGMDKDTALVMFNNSDGNDYFLNMDNQYLLTELKGIRDKNKTNLTRARYKYSMALIGMGIESYYKNRAEISNNDSIDVSDEVKKITSMISPILIPMIDAMADLNLDEVE